MKVHKKVLALSVSIMVFSASLCFGVLLIDNTNYEKASVVINKIENNYKIYIKGDSVMRISLKEKFHSCTTGEKVKTCGLIRNTVIKVVDLNTNEEKEEYANKDIIEVINDIIYNTSKNKIEITTNWNNRYTEEELNKLFHTNEKDIKVNFEQEIDEAKIKEVYYQVKIDAKNGTKIKELEVLKNDKIKKPKNPTRKGYTFVEWQVNGKKYNFDKKVKDDITLVAKWKKKSKK